MNTFNSFDNFNIEATTDLPSNKKLNGFWQRISIEPNPITGERYNIGVIFRINGKTHTKLIGKQSRVNCLFEHEAIQNIHFAIKHISETINNNRWNGIPDAFSLSDPMPASGNSIESILERLFFQTVTLGRPFEKEQLIKEDVEIITREGLIANIYDELKNMDFDNRRFIPQNRELIVDFSGHTIDAPLYANAQIADVISATNKAPHAIKNKINNSIIDLTAAINYRSDLKSQGLFILKPTKDLGFSKQQINDAEKAIDQVLWKIRNTTYLNVSSDTKELAEGAAEWFKQPA